MKRKTVFFTHASAVSALFILGNGIIMFPVKSADEYNFTGFLLAQVLAFLLYFAVRPLADRFFCDNANKGAGNFKKALLVLCYVAVAVFAVFTAAAVFTDFTEFVTEVILPDTPKILAIIIFGAVVVFFATRRQEDILKFCLIAFWFTVILMVFFFIAVAHNYNLRNIFIFRLPQITTLARQTAPYIKNPVLAVLLLSVYQTLVFKKNRVGAAVSGIAAGGVLLGLCVLSSVLLFGAPLAGRLDYPYAAAVSTVTVGRLFTRMDGFSYFIYFAAAITKITVCLFLVYSSLKKLKSIFK